LSRRQNRFFPIPPRNPFSIEVVVEQKGLKFVNLIPFFLSSACFAKKAKLFDIEKENRYATKFHHCYLVNEK
jgi:hypothetical protein